MSSDLELLEKARAGTISRDEVEEVASALDHQEPGRDRYTLIHILGRAGATQHESLIAQFLASPDDPMLARIAVDVLCNDWNRGPKYRRELLAFIRGVSWDCGQVFIIAVSAAGQAVREFGDQELLRELLDAWDRSSDRPDERDLVFTAIARASGKEWADILSAVRPPSTDGEEPGEIRWARARVSRSP